MHRAAFGLALLTGTRLLRRALKSLASRGKMSGGGREDNFFTVRLWERIEGEVTKIHSTVLETRDAISACSLSCLLGVKTLILIQPLVRQTAIYTVNASTCTHTYPEERKRDKFAPRVRPIAVRAILTLFASGNMHLTLRVGWPIKVAESHYCVNSLAECTPWTLLFLRASHLRASHEHGILYRAIDKSLLPMNTFDFYVFI